MPEISRFYGMIIKMHFDDHLPPHFHAEYGEHEALININTLAIIAGKLPQFTFNFRHFSSLQALSTPRLSAGHRVCLFHSLQALQALLTLAHFSSL